MRASASTSVTCQAPLWTNIRRQTSTGSSGVTPPISRPSREILWMQNTLPYELWLIILDIVIKKIISPHGFCNGTTFSEVLLRLRTPWTYQPVKHPPALRDLRLVCRMFNELIKEASPYFFMKDASVTVPPSTRALYIRSTSDGQTYLQRLLTEPSKSQRIVVLDIAGYEARNGRQEYSCHFDFLCENAHALSSVRTLTISLRHGTYDFRCGMLSPAYGASNFLPDPPRFWGRLNEAFPRLTCLVLRGGYKPTSGGRVVLKELRVLDMGIIRPDPLVHFPALRHAAFGTIWHSSIRNFTAWGHLESLLIQDMAEGVAIRWELIRNVRVLGVSNVHLQTFGPVPLNHPLENLYVYISTQPRNDHNPRHISKEDELLWLDEATERMLTVKKISFVYPERDGYGTPTMWLDFSDKELDMLGLSIRHIAWEGTAGPGAIVERIPDHQYATEDSNPETSEAGRSSKKKWFRNRWGKFRQFTSETLHL